MAMKSWVEAANDPACDFPIENLPFGVFRAGTEVHIGVAIGDQILDLHGCAKNGILSQPGESTIAACSADRLNSLMALGGEAWRGLRIAITGLLDIRQERLRERVARMLVRREDAEMVVPARIGDYTDFYASVHHATRVGKLFRPDNPLLPNYKHIPIGYHGRASSIVISGTGVRRPSGQTKPADSETPVFGPAKSLDYELEVGAFLGPGNALGETIPIDEAEQHLFGLCLVNDWSARDMQAWEYQPLGPFLGKSFATSISPWVVTLEALTPYRIKRAERAMGDPAPLPYLTGRDLLDGFDVTLEVWLQSAAMREQGIDAVRLSRGNLRDLYWSLAQMVTHHASNGCNLRPGDLLATGTVSGPEEGSEGCLLEMKHRHDPVKLPTGETRGFLQDGDEVILHGYAQREGAPRIGFGECRGRVEKAF